MDAATNLRVVARQMKAAQDEVRHIEPFSSQHTEFDLMGAYAAARLIHEARLEEGATPVGRKIGFTNSDMWLRYGVHNPIWAYMYDTTVVSVTDKNQFCSIAKFVEPKIEPEIVFHFHSAPSVNADLSEILNCIDWVAHAFEIVQSHFSDWKFRAVDAIVDCALHGTMLIGEQQAVTNLGEDLISSLERFSITLLCDGQIREIGTGANVLGNPLTAIKYLIEVLSKQTQSVPLQANEMVTTGTITAARSICACESWQTEIKGINLPGLSVQFVE
ncbi:MAG: decarboxylase [Gammaproteobacteria bacterium]|nr:decarboxylase [Gammaproteobacteria bacterium]